MFINKQIPVLSYPAQRDYILKLLDEMKDDTHILTFNMTRSFMYTIIELYNSMYNDDVGKVCLYKPIFDVLKPHIDKNFLYRFTYVPVHLRTNAHIIDRPQYIEILFDIISTGVTIPEEDIDALPRLVKDFIRL